MAPRRYKSQDGLIRWDVNLATVPPSRTPYATSQKTTGDVGCYPDGFVGSNPSFDDR